MTKKQRQAKLDLIIEMIEAFDFTIDRFGNYKKTFLDIIIRIKIKSVNIRIEKQYPESKEWYKITSQPYSKLNLKDFAQYLSKLNQL